MSSRTCVSPLNVPDCPATFLRTLYDLPFPFVWTFLFVRLPSLLAEPRIEPHCVRSGVRTQLPHASAEWSIKQKKRSILFPEVKVILGNFVEYEVRSWLFFSGALSDRALDACASFQGIKSGIATIRILTRAHAHTNGCACAHAWRSVRRSLLDAHWIATPSEYPGVCNIISLMN